MMSHEYTCACGCGEAVTPGSSFSPGHQNRPSRTPEQYQQYIEDVQRRKREYQRKWREENPEKVAEHMERFKSSDAYERQKSAARAAYHANPDAAWERSLRKKFGITADDYFAALDLQGGGCAICGELKPGGRPRADGQIRLAVDHCHTTGRVRGLLCRRCNIVIGKVRDRPILLIRAVLYLIGEPVTNAETVMPHIRPGACLNWILKRPTCPVCEQPTFGLLEGLRMQTAGDGLWTEAGRVRYRCEAHRA